MASQGTACSRCVLTRACMWFQARQQIAQLHTDKEGEVQHAAAAERAQQQLQDKFHTLERVTAVSPVLNLSYTLNPKLLWQCM